MTKSKDIDQHIQDLKKNVANQTHPIDAATSDQIEDSAQGAEASIPNKTPSFPQSPDGYKDPALQDQFLAESLDFKSEELKKKISMIGTEILVSTGVSYAIAWGIGHVFTLSSFWRIILGALLAFAVNGWSVYRIIKKC